MIILGSHMPGLDRLAVIRRLDVPGIGRAGLDLFPPAPHWLRQAVVADAAFEDSVLRPNSPDQIVLLANRAGVRLKVTEEPGLLSREGGCPTDGEGPSVCHAAFEAADHVGVEVVLELFADGEGARSP